MAKSCDIILVLAILACAVAGVARGSEPAPTPPVFTGPIVAGRLEAPPRREASGVAFSRRTPNLLWTHDDSGGAPCLYAVDTAGKKRGTIRLKGVKNDDWEDMAAFRRDGTAWLLIADTGDNDADRKSVRIHLLEEPAAEYLSVERELEISPAYSLRIRYEDGPRDCESVAVDVAGQSIYLLTKRDGPPRLYRVPLGVARVDPVIAKFVGTVPKLAGNSDMDEVLKMIAGKKVAWPTGMDFASDGSSAVILTYGGVLVFPRQPKQSWSDALSGNPTRVAFHGLSQAEGVCFSPDGKSIYVVSEGASGFVRYDRGP